MAPQSFLASLACLALLYTLIPRLPRGLPRLLLLLPCLPVFAWVPFSTRSPFLRCLLAFAFLWVCPSRLLLLSWDLSLDSPLSHGFLYFVVTTVFPVRIKGKASTPASTKQGALFPSILNSAILLVVMNGCLYRESFSLWQVYALYCFMIFFGLELVLTSAAKLATVLVGVETFPPSDKPFLASSLSDFWSRRWNLVVTNMLRQTVYAPILRFLCGGEGQDAVKKLANQSHADTGSKTSKECMQTRGMLQENSISKHHNVQPELSPAGGGYGDSENLARHPLPARAVASLATFVVSGLMHELIFCCLNQAQPTWEITMFFILHGLGTVLERVLRRVVPSGWKLPRPVAISYTLGVIFLTAAWLFMPPLTQAGSDVRIIAEFNQVQSVIVSMSFSLAGLLHVVAV